MGKTKRSEHCVVCDYFTDEQNSSKTRRGAEECSIEQHIVPKYRRNAISKHSCFSALNISEILHLHKSKIGKLFQCIDVDKKFQRKVSVNLAKICPYIFVKMQNFSFTF